MNETSGNLRIVQPNNYTVGDFVLFDGSGPTFNLLSWLLCRFDPVWRKQQRKPWHTAFLIDIHPTLGWIVGEAHGKYGVKESPLGGFKEPYLVFRWFDSPPDLRDVIKFMNNHEGDRYDKFWAYLFTILWYFVRWFPRIQDDYYTCWEFLYKFANDFGKPIDEDYCYPLITVLMTKVGYPD